jgi:hypothetical protein
MPSRETFYEVVFTRSGEETRTLVRAWSAEEAETNVRQALRAEGLAVPARLVVRPARRSAGQGKVAGAGLGRHAPSPA